MSLKDKAQPERHLPDPAFGFGHAKYNKSFGRYSRK